MERSLDDSLPKDDYEAEKGGLQISYPLLNCLQKLKEKHHTISKLHRERFEQVKKLVEALESYASHLEPSFVKIKLPPTAPNSQVPPTFDLSPTYVAKLDGEFTRVYEEYNKRIATVSQYAEDIINLWSELGTPQAQIDSQIVQFAREAPEQLGLHQDDLKRIAAKRDKLVSEKNQRERRLKELLATVEGLWDRLSIDQSERKQFLAANRGCGMRQINDFEDELSRLNELKRQNLHIFVEDARFKLQELWDSLYFSEEEMLDFAPAFSDVYSDALLSAHEQEINKLEILKEQRAPILAAVDKYRGLVQDREDLEKSSHDASRLMAKGQKGEKRDPGKLLREEKLRKRIAKELPKVEADLRKTLESWEREYGRPFCIHGERYLDELDAFQSRPAPPRSKTPSTMPPAREAPKSVGRGAQSQPRGRTGAPANQPPPRSKTPTATGHRKQAAVPEISNNLSRSMASGNSPSKVSPSKIPGASRLPMSTLRDGNNSPERRLKSAKSQTVLNQGQDDGCKTIRVGMEPPRAPPPKMKDLFIPPTPTPASNNENMADIERSSSIVRHMDPDDPYSDNHSRAYASTNSHSSTTSRPQYGRSMPSDESYAPQSPHPTSRQNYPMAPPSRQASNTSSVMSGSATGSAISGNENWETYTDNSEADEADATEAYYAKVKAQQTRLTNKRPAAAMGGQLGTAKRVRERTIVEEGIGVGACDDGWADDGDLVETF